MTEEVQVLIEFYKEEMAQARHAEQQRATMTNFVILISAALIGFITQKGFSVEALPAAILLIIIGTCGAITTEKMYEIHQFHSSRVRQWRGRISELHPNAQLLQLKEKANAEHRAEFPWFQRIRLHHLWLGFHIAIALVGIATILIATRRR